MTELQHHLPEGTPISPLGAKVAEILSGMFAGLHHFPGKLKKVDWSDDYYITMVVDDQRYSTWDWNQLTILVVLCHDAAIRCQIEACAPRRFRLQFHPRTRTGDFSRRHPSIEDAVTLIRKHVTDLRPAEEKDASIEVPV